MRKNDTALYKIKVGAVSVLLCGLFTVFAVGCSSNNEGDPDETENTSLSDSRSKSINFEPVVTSISKMTLPAISPSGDYTGAFNGGRPTETKPAPEGNKITIGELEIVPITRPDKTDKPEEPDEPVQDTEETEDDLPGIELPRVTLTLPDNVGITTGTIVYGFNG